MTNETLETILLLFTLFYVAGLLGVPVWLSLKKNEAFQSENPKLIPYKWGYYWGYFSILVAPLLFFRLWYDPQMTAFEIGATPSFVLLTPTFDQILMVALYGLSFVIIGVGVIKRIPIAWIASIGGLAISFAFQLNWIGLGLALLNAYYAWKRREELNFFSFFKKK